MRATVLLILILLNFVALSALASGAPSISCSHKTREFLKKPSRAMFGKLSSSSRDYCWSTFYTNANLNTLISFVRSGNVWAARYLVKHLQNLDGGNLEDSLIGLGEFGDHNMEHLLEFDKNMTLSRSDLNDALTMLPVVLSDKPDAQIRMLRSRRSKVLQVKRKDLAAQKSFALKAIDDFISEIKSKNQ